MTAEIIPALVTSKPLTRQPYYADNKPLNKVSGLPKSRFVDCVKKEMDKDASPEVSIHNKAESEPVLTKNEPDQSVSVQETDNETPGIEPELIEDSSAAIILKAVEPPILIAVNEASVSLNEATEATRMPDQVVSLPGEKMQAEEELEIKPSNSDQPINLTRPDLTGKNLITGANPANPSSELPPETRPVTGIQMSGQNQPSETENNNISKNSKTEQLPVQLLADERPAIQEKNLAEKQVDVKKLIQIENYRNLSQRVVSVNPPSQMNVQQEGSGRQTEAEVINLPGQVTTDTNLTSRGNLLENTNLSTLTAKSDPADVIDQIVKKATMMLKANASEMRIELKPEFLGKMMIKIVVEDGLVTARFVTENQQVKNLLESNLISLRQSLEAQGIRVEKTEVNIGLNNGGLFDGSEGNREWMWNHSGENPGRGEGYTESLFVNETAELEEQLAEITPANAYGFHENGTMDFII
ncbi:MAG: flagellar hook-length control protein FliK [Syntrophomonadaceae bacterium]